MPVIQQERGIKTVAGLPARWGRRAYRELSEALRAAELAKRNLKKAQDDAGRVGPGREEQQAGYAQARYVHLSRLLDDVTSAPMPLDATDAHLCVLAARYANDCSMAGLPLAAYTWTGKTSDDPSGRVERVEQAAITEPAALRARMAEICRLRGIEPPNVDDHTQAILRCTDPAWWRRGLRKTHGRTFEAAAIRLGFVSSRAGAYASDETVARRMSQVARNRAALESVKIKNEDGYECTLADAASKTTSNKRIRRGELMLRLAGCEEIALELGHVGVFFTLTAPSKYHAVIEKSGTVNPNYNDALPREVQAYLQRTWARIRTAYGRHDIRPYGFRIAEPHHDGCVHWHGLLFMPAYKVRRFCHIVRTYALAEDGGEPGAAKHRATFERIDTKKGSAAAYIAKYISKNIDDDSEDAHDEVIGADGQPVKIVMPNDAAKKASQRVDAWAGVWGIRQFQPIGQPPVTVWREMRRIEAAKVAQASPAVRLAWEACQRVERKDKETGEVTVERPANFANYIRAQGGVCIGRDYRIAIANEPGLVMAEGRYGMAPRVMPIGVRERIAPAVVYASTRHTWTRTSAQVGFAPPRSPVNNCTASDWPGRPKAGDEWFRTVPEPGPVAEFTDEDWYASDEFARYWIPPEDVAAMELAAEARQPFDAALLSERGRAAFDAQAAYARANR
jgi:hypothetical protein